MRLYTKQGDAGETGLLGGRRVSKDAARVQAYGAVDELNAFLGLAAAAALPDPLPPRVREIQSALFDIGAHLAAAPEAAAPPFKDAAAVVQRLEAWIDEASDALPSLKNFILPGGSEAAARLHLARTVCRRAEREVVTLANDEAVDGQVVVYLNRLGDLLFAWARFANHAAGAADVEWHAGGK